MKNLSYFLAAGLISVSLIACGGGNVKDSKEYKDLKAELDKIKSMDSTEAANIETYKAMNTAFMAGKKDEMLANVHPEYVDHNPDSALSNKKGTEALVEMMNWVVAANTEMSMTYDHIYAEGDMLYAHGKMKGKNTGAIDPKIPATNKNFDVDYYEVIRFDNGKIRERWGLMDMYAMMQQLGMQM